jgi:hypothetical protein
MHIGGRDDRERERDGGGELRARREVDPEELVRREQERERGRESEEYIPRHRPAVSTDWNDYGVGYAPRQNRDFYDMYFEQAKNSGQGGDQDFQITLKDYPYRVVTAPFDPNSDSFEFPLMPILQFKTWHKWFHVTIAESDKEDNSQNSRGGKETGGGLVRCHISDDTGDWCGSIVLDERWTAKTRTSRHEFIAISDAKNFTLEECNVWTYYIPKEREQSEWDLYYVLLIERKAEKWERVGLGKVFREAFRSAKWREIMLG